MTRSRRTFRQALSPLAVATALAVAGLVAGPATAQSNEGAPTVSSIAIVSDGGHDDTYAVGDTIEVLVTFSEEVIDGGVLRLALDVGGESRQAPRFMPAISSTSVTTMAFDYTVREGDSDSNGVSIPADALTLVSGTLQDADGNDAILTHDPIADDRRHKVDGIVPTISSIDITSDPGDDDTYGVGDDIEVTLTFSEEIQVHNPLRIALDIGGEFRSATYDEQPAGGSGSVVAFSSTTTIVLNYTVAVGDTDTDGISIPADVLPRGRGHVRDIAGNQADLSHDAVPDDPGHMVNAPGGL